jgi:hypothetical protein
MGRGSEGTGVAEVDARLSAGMTGTSGVNGSSGMVVCGKFSNATRMFQARSYLLWWRWNR